MREYHPIALTSADEYIHLRLNNDFTEEGKLIDERKQDFKEIEGYGDVDMQILYFLAYAYQHNYIVLNYELNYVKPATSVDLAAVNAKCSYYPIYYNSYSIIAPRGLSKDRNPEAHSIRSNSRSEIDYKTNTSILFNDSHYALIYHPDKNIQIALIEEFMRKGEKLWTSNKALDYTRARFGGGKFVYGSGLRSKRLKIRHLKQRKQTFKYKYKHRERQSKLRSKQQTLKLKKINSKRTRKTH
jgi:hypothetical protein